MHLTIFYALTIVIRVSLAAIFQASLVFSHPGKAGNDNFFLATAKLEVSRCTTFVHPTIFYALIGLIHDLIATLIQDY
jgi:hypothetical protein